MSHHAHRLASPFIPRSVILAIVALVAAFFAVWGATAYAQSRPDRPDLRITKASFNGRDLHVEYVNATGVYDRRRYEVGFQWYDAAGRPVGERHWLPQPEVERGGIAILDTKYRTDLTYRRSGGNYNRRLLDFILQRPNDAEELRITVDDGDRIPETDESNNIARLRIPLPDLQITGATFRSSNQLELSYRNANPSPIPLPFRIGFTWAAESGTHLTPTRWINVLEPAAGATETVVLSRTDASYLTPQGRQAGDRLDWYFERRPGTATRMKITIDDAGTVREANEQNNLVTARPILPDLVVRDAKLDGDRLTFTYGNDGEGSIRDIASRVLIQWVDATGKPIGGPRWIGFAQMNPKQTFAVNADRFDVEYAVAGTNRTTTQRLSSYLRERPAGATQLTITIDDEQHIIEANEQNNGATVTFATALQPDLVLEQFTVTNERPSFTYRNRGGPTPADQRIPIVLEWLDARGGVLPLRYDSDLGALVAGEFRPFVSGAALRRWREANGRWDGDGGTVFFLAFQEPARGATALRITIDPANAIPERDEQNNALIIPINRADFSIRDSRFDGTELSFTYAASGSDPAVRPPLSLWFEWADTSGARVGDLAWSDVAFLLPGTSRAFRSADARVAVGAADGSSRVLSMRAFLAKPPTDAQGLRVFVDGPNRYDEPDETDNVVLLPIPNPSRPDFAITSTASFTADALTVTIRNTGTGPAPDLVSYWFEWVNAAGGRVSPLFWHDARGAITEGAEARLDVAKASLRRERPNDAFSDPATFADLMELAPESATHLKVRVDGPNMYAERDERNNVLLLPKPAPPQPDLTIARAELTAEGLAVDLANVGAGTAPSVPWSLIWVDASGAAIGAPLTGSWEALAPKGSRTMIVGVRPLVPGSAVAYVTQPPDRATHLKVMVDSDNAIMESDEANNTTLLPRQLPDLTFARVTAKWDGRDPKIEYVGTNRGTVDVERIVLGLQWLDASGRASGPSYAPFEVFGRLRAGVTSSTWALPFWDSGETSTRPLGRYLLLPPSDATHLQLTLDPENTTLESDEANNTAVVERPASVPLADLTITNAKFAEGTFALTYKNIGPVHAGYFITLSTWFEWVDAKGSRIGDLVWHDGESLDPKYVVHLDAATTVSSVPRGKFLLREFLASPPSSATHLKVTVDGPNTLLESNEANNAAVLPVPVQPKSNLQLIGIDALPNDIILVRTLNRGKGKVAGFQWELQWEDATGMLLGTPVREDGIALASGNSYNISIDAKDTGSSSRFDAFFGKPPAGAARVRATVDPENAIPESDETNNRKIFDGWKPPEPPKQPDLAFTNVFLVPPKRERLVIGFENKGKVAAPEFSWAMSWVDAAGKSLGESYNGIVPALKPNWRFGVGSDLNESDPNGKPMPRGKWLRQPKPEGAVNLEITIDPENVVAESDETNNRQMFDKWSPPEPTAPEKLADLRIADFTMDPIAPRAGERVWFIVRVENVGSAATGKQTATGIIIDPEKSGTDRKLIGQFTAADIAPGKSFTHRWTKENYYGWVAVAGTHTIEVCADRAKVVPEGDETNNCARKEVTVGAPVDEKPKLPDLTITDATLDTAALRFWYHNRGESATASGVSLWYEWVDASGTRVGELRWINVDAIQAGSKRQGNQLLDFATLASDRGTITLGDFVSGAPPSATHLRITIDGSSVHAESNEQNNSVLLARPVVALPDFVVGDVAVRDGALRVTVRNTGRANAGTTDVWFMWFAGGRALSSSAAVDLPAIAAGRTTMVIVPLDAKTEASQILREPPKDGTRVRIFLDGSRKVKEVNEDNNDTMLDRAKLPTESAEPPKPVEPPKSVEPAKPAVPSTPDLVPEALRVTPAKPVAGGPIAFSATVRNRGSAAGAHIASFTVDFDGDGEADTVPTMGGVPALTPNATHRVTWEDPPPFDAGTYAVEFCADADDDIAEANEENNCASLTFTVAGAGARAPGNRYASAPFDTVLRQFTTIVPSVLGVKFRAW